MLDAGANSFKAKRVIWTGAGGVAHGDAGLADPPQALHDECLVAVVERLIAADEQRRWSLRIEDRSHEPRNPLNPELRRALSRDPQIIVVRWHELPVRVLEPALLDPIDKNHYGWSAGHKGRPRLGCRADQVSDRKASCLDDPITEPAHAPGLLDPVLLRKGEISIDMTANFISVEVYGVEADGEQGGECGLAGSWQTHDQDFALHRIFSDWCQVQQALWNEGWTSIVRQWTLHIFTFAANVRQCNRSRTRSGAAIPAFSGRCGRAAGPVAG